MTRRLRVLLAGYTGAGTQNHQADMYEPAFTAHPGFSVVGVTDTAATGDADRDRARGRAEALGVPYVDDLDDALTTVDADVVSACVPLDARQSAVTAALRAGRHVLVDKPMALSATECAAIAAVAAETGLVCLPAHHQRFHPAVRAASAAVASGRVGLPWNVQGDFLVAGGDPCPLGELANFGVYPVDVVLAMTALPVTEVFAHDSGDGPAVLCLRHERGMTSTLTVGRVQAIPDEPMAVHRYRISGSHGVLMVDPTRFPVTVRSAAGRRVTGFGGGTVTALLDEFHAAVSTGRPAAVGADDARAVAAVLEAAARSARTGSPVPLEARP
ncbi:Gfo/Idh/MocA family oxidoreductase [Micromonospora sp. NPDC050686]|uniref:Gfo/Idh/MocA family protein n=1 Tax=Micromonospora sp. NPDC050686 TaxID=3154631 RepID=UPI0033EC3455